MKLPTKLAARTDLANICTCSMQYDKSKTKFSIIQKYLRVTIQYWTGLSCVLSPTIQNPGTVTRSSWANNTKAFYNFMKIFNH